MVKPDYAKWMLDDPRVNFAISTRGREPGLDHLGIQVEDKTELQEVYARLRKAGARSSSRAKPHAAMPSRRSPGSTTETFHTTGESIDYGDGTGERVARVAHEKTCCAPQESAAPATASACCE